MYCATRLRQLLSFSLVAGGSAYRPTSTPTARKLIAAASSCLRFTPAGWAGSGMVSSRVCKSVSGASANIGKGVVERQTAVRQQHKTFTEDLVMLKAFV